MTVVPSFLRRWYPNINIRITLPFLLATIVVAAIGVFIVTNLVAGSIQERLNNQLVDSAQAAVSTIVDLERQQLATLRLAAFTEGVPSALESQDIETLEVLLRPLVTNAGVDNLVVYDAEGDSVFQLVRGSSIGSDLYVSPQPPIDVERWDGVQRVIAGRADLLGDKFVDIIEDEAVEATIFVSGPILNEQGTLVGGVTVGVTARNFALRVSEQSLSNVTLFARDGRILGSTFRLLADSGFRLTREEATQLIDDTETFSPVTVQIVSDSQYQTLYAPLELRSQTVGLVAIALSSDFITDRIGTSRNIFAALFSALFLAVALSGLAVARSITNPVQRLVETTRAIRSGDLTRRVGLQTPDELGELSASFDHMTTQLIQRNEEINELYVAQVQETAQRDAVLTSISDVVIVLTPGGQPILQNAAANLLIRNIQGQDNLVNQFDTLCGKPEQLTEEPQTVSFGDAHFSVLSTPVIVDQDHLLGYVMVFRDITALIDAERIKDELVLQLSHELRTPLTASMGYTGLVKMLGGDRVPPEIMDYVDRSHFHLEALGRMINHVIDVSAILSGRFYIETERFELTPVIEEVFQTYHPRMKARGLRFTLLVPDDVFMVEGDRERISQVVEAIVENGHNYTMPGGWVELSLEAEPDAVSIHVVDSGVGIEASEIDQVFERLYRGHAARAGETDARGLGLGLYLSRVIVNAHRGTITLDSTPGAGTFVTVRLPRQP